MITDDCLDLCVNSLRLQLIFPLVAAAPAFGSTNSASSTPVFGASTAQPSPFGNTQPAADQSKPNFNFGGSAVPTFGASTGEILLT